MGYFTDNGRKIACSLFFLETFFSEKRSVLVNPEIIFFRLYLDSPVQNTWAQSSSLHWTLRTATVEPLDGGVSTNHNGFIAYNPTSLSICVAVERLIQVHVAAWRSKTKSHVVTPRILLTDIDRKRSSDTIVVLGSSYPGCLSTDPVFKNGSGLLIGHFEW